MIIRKYKWLSICAAAFFILLIFLPMLFLIFISTETSSEEEDALIINTASDSMIMDALMLEKEYGGNWIDYLIAEYILNGFDPEEVYKSSYRELWKRLSENENLRDILGDNYKGFLDMKPYFYAVYGGIAGIEEVTFTYKDEEGETKEGTKLEIQSSIFHPYLEGYDFTHYNDYGADRSFGGERSHQGNDIMADKGVPIVAVAPGYIEHIGWNTLGGWRIGIIDAENRYWYYAHMQKYASGIKQGQYIEAGEKIGYVGDSGYGPQGTTGKFAPHLHIQIGVLFPGEKERVYINPYGIIRFAESNRKVFNEETE